MDHLAVVTGASTGIGFELARYAAHKDYDLIIAADEPEIEARRRRCATKAPKSPLCRQIWRLAKAWINSMRRSAHPAARWTLSWPMQAVASATLS